MIVGYVNRLLWLSLLITLWGFVGLILESLKGDTQITTSGLPAATLLTLGLLIGLIGQVLLRLAAKIEVLELRISKLSEKNTQEKSS
jgi:hypothetical protein